MKPKQNKPSKWEDEWDKKFIDGVRSPIDGRLAELERVKQFIRQLLSDQKHDYEILVNTIIDNSRKQRQELIEDICVEIASYSTMSLKDTKKLLKIIKKV